MNVKFIKAKIEEHGLKKNYIAKELNMNYSSFIEFLNERIDLRSKYIPKLAEILQVEIKDLF